MAKNSKERADGMRRIVPAIIPGTLQIGVEGQRLYRARCLRKRNIYAFSELSEQAKDLVYDYFFGYVLGNQEQVDKTIRSFRFSSTGFAAYLEICDVDFNDFVMNAVIRYESPWQHVVRHRSDALFYHVMSGISDVFEKHLIVEHPYDSPEFINGIHDAYEPLKIPNTFKFPTCYEFDMYARSYMKAAGFLCDEIVKIRKENATPGIFIMYNYCPALPFIQCCRLAVELKIKAALHRIGAFKPKKHEIHDLEKLWNSFESWIPKDVKAGRPRLKLRLMQKYVSFLKSIDETGNVSRYPDDTKNKWVDIVSVFENLTGFFDMMDAIDYSVFDSKGDQEDDSN